ncbi:MAG: LPS assembly lipoprotein LptE [Nitrospinaceae bacterium]
MNPFLSGGIWRPAAAGFLACVLLIPACGYRLVGTGSALPPHIKTLAVPLFRNTSAEPTLQRQLTETIRRAFITDGRLRLVDDPKKADLLLKGTLNFYDIRAVAFNENDVATQYWVYLGIEMVARDQVKKSAYLRENFRTRWDYRASANVVDSESERQKALDQAYRDVATRLISILIDQF